MRTITKQTMIFEQVLRGDLQPWRQENEHNEQFASIIADIDQTEPQFQELYNFEFYRYFNNKTRYYHKLITNDTVNFCNQNIAQIGSDDDRRIIKFKLGKMLKKTLPTYLRDIAKVIKTSDYSLVYINPHKSTFDYDAAHKSDTYVVQLLKVALVKAYLEIQNAFKDYIKDFYMELEDLYLQYLNEPIPENSFLKPVQPIIEISPTKTIPVEIEQHPLESFKYIKYDIANDNLVDLCDSLKKYNLIAQTTKVNDFKKVFSGKQITKHINWTGNSSELYYFIKLLHNDYRLVENMKQQHWKIACACFVQEDDTPFEYSKVRGLKKPQLTYKAIEKAVELLM